MMRFLSIFLAIAAPQMAAAAPAEQQASAISGFLPLIAVFAVFYFLIMRPQQKRLKDHHRMLGELKKGDQVMTAGGIIGKVSKIAEDDTVHIEIAESVTVKVARATIANIYNPVIAANKEKVKKTAVAPVANDN